MAHWSKLRLAVALVALAVALAFSAGTAAAAPGDLDPSFSGSGKLSFAPGGRTTQVNDVAIQPDGKIVLAGWIEQGGGNIDFLVARLNPNGSFDQGFGSGGIKTVDFPGKGPTSDTASGVALQPDGKIVVAGTSTYTVNTSVAIARLEPNGDPDGSFGGELTDAGAPVAGIRLLQNARGNDVALDSSGRIIVAGTQGEGTKSDMYVARLTSSGAGDATFNVPKNDYFIAVDYAGGGDGATRMVVQPDGKIVLVGWTNETAKGIVRVIPGGVLDQDFGSGGKLGGFASGNGPNGLNDVALEPDGRIDAAGYGGNTPGNMEVMRWTAAGGFDNSLNGAANSVSTDFGGSDSADAIALQANGKIVLAGAGAQDIGVVRLQSSGVPDATFGAGGKRKVNFPGVESESYSMALQPDGKIVLAGYAGSSAAVVRLQGDSAAAGGGPGGPGAPGAPGGPNVVGRGPRMSKFSARVKSGGRSVSFVLRSDQNCTGSISGSTVKAYAAAKKRRVSIGSVRFKLTAGKSKTVVLKLSKKSRRLLARRHSLRVKFTIALTGSSKSTSSRTLTLRLPRAK
jgi:uncharacterized delta-60 repeat protein